MTARDHAVNLFGLIRCRDGRVPPRLSDRYEPIQLVVREAPRERTSNAQRTAKCKSWLPGVRGRRDRRGRVDSSCRYHSVAQGNSMPKVVPQCNCLSRSTLGVRTRHCRAWKKVVGNG